MPAFVFTFPVEDELRRDSYVVVDRETEVDARLTVIERYGRKFGSCYPLSDPATTEMMQKYGLTEIEFGQ